MPDSLFDTREFWADPKVFIETMLAEWLPSISQSLNFRAPVRIGDAVEVTVTVAELVPERQRARLICICKVGDEVVLDGEALVKVPSTAKSKRPLPRL